MYGYMADLGTEPRWSRFHETFSEDADLVGDIVAALVNELQGPEGTDGLALSPQTNVAMTLKHFPGGGPQQLGLDAHYTFGKNQFYTDPSGRYGFDYHLRPFERAIAAGVGAIMPYYGVPVGATHDGQAFDGVGMAFSKEILTDLLREELGFEGYINSDSGIIEERGWGVEDYRINPETGQNYTVADRTAIAIRAGTDILSEFRSGDTIVELVEQGRLSEAEHLDPAVERLLTEQFALGLFENPYVDAAAAPKLIGTSANRARGLEAQRQSIVLLQNRAIEGRPVLPLASEQNLYVIGFPAEDFAARGHEVTDGNHDAQAGEVRPAVPPGTDFAVIKVLVNNAGASAYRSDAPETGGRAVDPELGLIDPRMGRLQESWGAQDSCVVGAASNVIFRRQLPVGGRRYLNVRHGAGAKLGNVSDASRHPRHQRGDWRPRPGDRKYLLPQPLCAGRAKRPAGDGRTAGHLRRRG
jgi:beta-glucosidase